MGETERTCVVIDRSTASSISESWITSMDVEATTAGKFKYYVHWHDFNRRMDEWINADEIVRRGTDEEIKHLQKKEHKEKEKEKEHDKTGGTVGTGDHGDSKDSGRGTRGHKRKTEVQLFLDHKTLHYDVDPFLFYVMCEVDA
ncbi:hypothetical protein DYB31_011375, partial [Aphanomyces astaci]